VLTVIAKDVNDNVVELPGGTELTFSSDQGTISSSFRGANKSVASHGTKSQIKSDITLGSFDDLNDQLEPSAVLPVLYSDANTGDVLFLANGNYEADVVETQVTITVSSKGENPKTGKKSVNVVKKPDHLDVSSNPKQIQHSETSVIKASLAREDKTIPDIPTGTKLNFSLETGETHGSLQNALNIDYSNVQGGDVKFVSDGDEVTGDWPLGIKVGSSLFSNPSVSGVGLVVMKPAGSAEYFSQDGDAWKGDNYDNFIDKDETEKQGHYVYKTMGSKGCATTCMAMILKQGGSTLNPGSLNTWMIANNHYVDHIVSWDAIPDYPGSTYKREGDPHGDGLETDDNGNAVPSESTPVSISLLDPLLSAGSVIIAQVYNPTTRNGHWVLVTGRSGNQYRILDPGGYSRTTLADYGNIYRYVSFKKK
jgi:hypothetical protein